MLRLGVTESNLLLLYYLRHYYKIEPKLIESLEKEFINWLYSTSGFYDTKIKGSYFDFNFLEILNSEVYNNYMNTLLHVIKNFNGNCCMNYSITIPNTNDKMLKVNFNAFLNNMDPYRHVTIKEVFQFISNKKLLLVHNFSVLMKSQYENGNLKKAFSYFPDIESITTYEPVYSFMNNGPDNNIWTTCHKISFHLLEIIKNNSCNCLLISMGAYSTIIMDLVLKSMDIPFMVLGGEMASYFGIITERGKIHFKKYINEYCIPVPENYKPPNYKLIENGCYW